MRQAERRSEFQLSTKAETAEEAAETEAAEEGAGAGGGEGYQKQQKKEHEQEQEEEKEKDIRSSQKQYKKEQKQKKQQSSKPRMSFCKICFCSFGPLFPPVVLSFVSGAALSNVISTWSYLRFQIFPDLFFCDYFWFHFKTR